MLDEQYWNRRWEERRIGFHQDEINPYLLKFWPTMKVPQEARVLVPLCGKSRDMCWLAEQGHRVTGVEFSQQAVKEYFDARGETPMVSQNNAHMCFSCEGRIDVQVGDFLTYQPNHLFDAFYDRAALVAMSPDMRERYIKQLMKMMKPQSQGLLVSLEILDESHQGPPFSVQQDIVEKLLSKHGSIEVLDQVFLTETKKEVVYQMSVNKTPE